MDCPLAPTNADRTPFAKQLLAIQPDVTMAVYQRDFELLSTPLQQMSMEDLGSVFVKGSQLEIKEKFRLWLPNGLGQILQLTQLMDCNKLVNGCGEFLGPRISMVFTAQNRKFGIRLENGNRNLVKSKMNNTELANDGRFMNWECGFVLHF